MTCHLVIKCIFIFYLGTSFSITLFIANIIHDLSFNHLMDSYILVPNQLIIDIIHDMSFSHSMDSYILVRNQLIIDIIHGMSFSRLMDSYMLALKS